IIGKVDIHVYSQGCIDKVPRVRLLVMFDKDIEAINLANNVLEFRCPKSCLGAVVEIPNPLAVTLTRLHGGSSKTILLCYLGMSCAWEKLAGG
ncbi:MAG: hypothetical protein V3T23_11185, partial [Nitrososphaerales archaeon]